MYINSYKKKVAIGNIDQSYDGDEKYVWLFAITPIPICAARLRITDLLLLRILEQFNASLCKSAILCLQAVSVLHVSVVSDTNAKCFFFWEVHSRTFSFPERSVTGIFFLIARYIILQ